MTDDRTSPRFPLFFRRVRQMAERTPAHRDRYIDFMRALAISLVVLGHWLAVVIVVDNGIDGENALGRLPWAQPLTWFFQVMPVFFLVGGYSNAASLDSHLRKGGDAPGWLLGRTDRLLRPTSLLLGVLWVASVIAVLAGLEPELVGTGVWAATIPLWFLSAYLGVVLLAPVMYVLHRRYGAAVPILLFGTVLLLDVLRLGVEVPVVGEANHLLVWLTMHQLGFLWRDRWRETGPAVPGSVAVAGFGLLVLLTTVGPYPTSMVDVPGEALGNASPPTFALMVLGVTQSALLLAVAGRMRRALRNIRLWTAVVAVNAVVLTLFLWHMTAAVLAGLLVYAPGILPQPSVGSGEWLLLRIPWLFTVVVVMCVLLAMFGGVEARTVPSSGGWRAGDVRGVQAGQAVGNVLTWVALPAVFVGFVWCALAGPAHHGVGALPTVGFLVYLVSATVLRLARRRAVAAAEAARAR